MTKLIFALLFAIAAPQLNAAVNWEDPKAVFDNIRTILCNMAVKMILFNFFVFLIFFFGFLSVETC